MAPAERTTSPLELLAAQFRLGDRHGLAGLHQARRACGTLTYRRSTSDCAITNRGGWRRRRRGRRRRRCGGMITPENGATTRLKEARWRRRSTLARPPRGWPWPAPRCCGVVEVLCDTGVLLAQASPTLRACWRRCPGGVHLVAYAARLAIAAGRVPSRARPEDRLLCTRLPMSWSSVPRNRGSRAAIGACRSPVPERRVCVAPALGKGAVLTLRMPRSAVRSRAPWHWRCG